MNKFMIRNRIDRSEHGQTLMVILLIMIVGLTIGISLMARTTTDISLTTKVTDSSRAFNAAEAGIEEAIKNAAASPGTLTTGTYTPTVVDLGGGGGIYPAVPQVVKVGETFTVWLTGYNPNPIDICFGKQGLIDEANPTIAVSYFYLDGTTIKSSSFVVDAWVMNPSCVNCETPSVNVCPGVEYHWGIKNLAIKNSASTEPLGFLNGATPYALRFRPIRVSTIIAVNPNGNLPVQGNDISSAGKAGDAARKINVKNPLPALPLFADYVLYSYSNLSK